MKATVIINIYEVFHVRRRDAGAIEYFRIDQATRNTFKLDELVLARNVRGSMCEIPAFEEKSAGGVCFGFCRYLESVDLFMKICLS